MIFEILMDFKSDSQWNPFIREIDEDISAGSKLKIVIQAPRGKSMTFRPKIQSYIKDKKFFWLSHAFIPGLLVQVPLA